MSAMAVTKLRKQAMDAGRLSKPLAYMAATNGAGELARIILATLGRDWFNLSHVASAKCGLPFFGSSRISAVTGPRSDTVTGRHAPSSWPSAVTMIV